MQKIQDWITQQWVILTGQKIDLENFSWLIGAFGNVNGTGEDFINQLAQKENLIIERNVKTQGLISSIDKLNLSENQLSNISKEVIRFYEKTTEYDLFLKVKWNPFFRIFGILIYKLFSNRIKQLNIPTKNIKIVEPIKSEIITLSDPKSNEVKYTIWFRTFQSNGQVLYSGVYSLCNLPSEKTCIKAVFPLPNGNATVIMLPSVGENGELILESSGKKIGDAGFYFLLNDSKGNYWTKYIRSFRDRLIINTTQNYLLAEQILTLWNLKVLRFRYKIESK